MSDLFSSKLQQPLAARLRPETLDDYIGQEHILGEHQPLRKAIEQDLLHSMVFWGPPGTGKTSLARLIANKTGCHFIAISAVLGSVKDIRDAVDRAQQKQAEGKRTILFVDEVHRFNKSQQDAFLPFIEDGTFIFIGATTENPSFELNNALLSRARVYVLKSLDENALSKILERALNNPASGFEQTISLDEEAHNLLIKLCEGDARKLLNFVEMLVDVAPVVNKAKVIDKSLIKTMFGQRVKQFDKGGDVFYEQISALHKSVRGSNPDAALYWFARMLVGGCDPLYIARRVVRMASEDVGNADPRALQLAINAWDVQSRLGSPEGELAVAQALVYCAVAAKSNSVYKAFKIAMSHVKEGDDHPVPIHLRNAPTKLMKEMNYGEAYRYDHDEPDAFARGQTYFPDDLVGTEYYQPVERGLEKQIADKLKWLRTGSKS